MPNIKFAKILHYDDDNILTRDPENAKSSEIFYLGGENASLQVVVGHNVNLVVQGNNLSPDNANFDSAWVDIQTLDTPNIELISKPYRFIRIVDSTNADLNVNFECYIFSRLSRPEIF